MRIDHRPWRDGHKEKFLTNEGYLTDYAKTLMTELGVFTLEDLLNKLELSGKGYRYETDLDRPDVTVSGSATAQFDDNE